MAKEVERLTPFRVKALTAPGRYADGGRLYLTIGKNGSKSWSFIYRFHGRTREAGLGAVSDVTLKRARQGERGRRISSAQAAGRPANRMAPPRAGAHPDVRGSRARLSRA
jgi:hypothetical protein